ncbi:uncharacterized protein LOC144751675 [Ciona intestinalis]
MQEFMIKRISLENLDEVKELVKVHFSPRRQWACALNAPLAEVVYYDQLRAERNLHDNAAVGVFLADTGKLVAVSVNFIAPAAVNTLQTKHLDEEINKLATKYEWLGYMNGLAEHLLENMWQDLGAKKILMSSLCTVDAKYARRGLLKKMLIKNETLASEHGCDFVTSLCSSSFSRRACQNIGHNIFASMDVRYYVDAETGTMPFSTMSPLHAECCLFYKPVKPKPQIYVNKDCVSFTGPIINTFWA